MRRKLIQLQLPKALSINRLCVYVCLCDYVWQSVSQISFANAVKADLPRVELCDFLVVVVKDKSD